MSDEKKEVFEFTFYCDKCGETVKTRSDDGKSVKGCPNKGCSGRMLYSAMKEVTDTEGVEASSSEGKSAGAILPA